MPVPLGVIAAQRTVTVVAFDPLSIAWHSAWWASDPGWTPPADGGAVTSWRNAGTSAAHATPAGGGFEPTYRAAYAALGNRPALQFANKLLYSSTPVIAQPNHLFIVCCYETPHGSQPTPFDGTVPNLHRVTNNGPGADVWVNAGDYAVATGAGFTGAAAIAALFDGASSALRLNGTVRALTGTCGVNSLGSVRLGYNADNSNPFKGAIAFLAIKDTALTAGEITNLETWAKNYYGVPIP